MKRWQSWGQKSEFQITCADVSGFLSFLTKQGVWLRHVKFINKLEAKILIAAVQKECFESIAEKKGVAYIHVRTYGPTRLLQRVLHRPIMLVGVILLFILSWYIPGRVLFVTVEGNQTIPTARILEEAARAGVYFGASRRAIRSEQVKNHIINEMPQLKWVGVNTSGCVARINVSEKEATQGARQNAVCSIVAERDGVITSCTVTAGSVLCVPGQAVKKGEILV